MPDRSNGRDPSISVEELAEALEQDRVTVLDATYFAPAERRDARGAFEERRIAGARFFDINSVADRATGLPHMLPDTRSFETAMGELGVENGRHVVVYDRAHLRAAPRVWWTLRRFGHDDVSVLAGGLEAWCATGLPTERGPPAHPHPRSRYRATPRDELHRTLDDAIGNVSSERELYLDARPTDRFDGRSSDHWTSRRGHIRHSRGLPAGALLDNDGFLKPEAELRRIVTDIVKGDERRIVATCGSGISASVLAFALFRLGLPDVAVFDGSWAEWGEDGRTLPFTETNS